MSFAFKNGHFDKDWEKHANGKQNNQNLMPGTSVHQYTNRQISRVCDWIIIIYLLS